MTANCPTETLVVVRVTHDGRYASIAKQRQLAQFISQRAWSIDGVKHTAASAFESVDALVLPGDTAEALTLKVAA